MAAENEGLETEKHKILREKKATHYAMAIFKGVCLVSGNLPIRLIQH